MDRHSLLSQAEEELAAAARPPAVEAKRELVEVVVEMCVGDRTVVRPEQPPLEGVVA